MNGQTEQRSVVGLIQRDKRRVRGYLERITLGCGERGRKSRVGGVVPADKAEALARVGDDGNVSAVIVKTAARYSADGLVLLRRS